MREAFTGERPSDGQERRVRGGRRVSTEDFPFPQAQIMSHVHVHIHTHTPVPAVFDQVSL